MVTRKKYDNQNRVISKSITDNKGVSKKYTYTYSGDNTNPKRVNKHVDKIAELVYQEDLEGRMIYNLDENSGLITEVSYNVGFDTVKRICDESLYGMQITELDEYKNSLFEVAKVTKKETDELYGLQLTCKVSEEYQYKFLKQKYDLANAHLHNEDFINIGDSEKIDSVRFAFDFQTGDIVQCTVMYLKDNYVVHYVKYDYNESLEPGIVIEDYEAITIVKDDSVKSLSASKQLNGVEAFVEFENKVDKEFPYIPMENNIFNRHLIYAVDGGLIETGVDTINEKTEDGGCRQTVHSTATYPDNTGYDYSVIVDMDNQGRITHIFNEKDQQDETMKYNDMGLITEHVTTIFKNSGTKMIMSRKAAAHQPAEEIKHIEHYTYTEDGKLVLVAAHNDLMCNFEAYEYDENGREIYQATFSTYQGN